jgi:hypothetical protein
MALQDATLGGRRSLLELAGGPRFGELMDQAKAKGRVSVRRNLFRLANAGNVAAAIFLSKNRTQKPLP